MRAGGNAVDATVAAAAVINVVQPYTSGIGGAGFLVIYLAAEDRFVTINSGALAPLAFDRDAMLENARPDLMEMRDLREYRTELPEPTHANLLGYDIFGMGPPTAGSLTIGETLHMLEGRPGPATEPPTSRVPRSTTHLSVVDGEGNVVAFTTTIDSWGGSGIAVPGRGFLLNNWLGFDLTPGSPDGPAPRKHPRSGMSPTIVMRDGAPVLVVGTPGGRPIITTVARILYDRLALGSTLPEALWAPRLSPQNKETWVEAEAAFMASPLRAALEARGHPLVLADDMCHATAVEFLPGGRLQAVAEANRDHTGSAMVVDPEP